jgi:NAD(P)-dependent dehydrogenase (short-subunit alcohol dehydrogenase family)
LAYPYLTKPGASVINISAPQALLAMELQVHVCAAKAGVDMVTRVLAMEWGPSGIRVNSLVPGPIAGTEGMARLAPTAELQHTVTESVPLHRQGTPQDVAHAALFLASPLAAYVSGAVLPVDGGWSLGGVGVAMAGLADFFRDQNTKK